MEDQTIDFSKLDYGAYEIGEGVFEENINGNRLVGYTRNYIRFSAPYNEDMKNKVVYCNGLSVEGEEIFGLASKIKI